MEKVDKNRAIFLLGGRDLEMEAIREFLEANGYKEGVNFFDKKPTWSDARLSTYKNEIKKHKDKTIYTIELSISEDADKKIYKEHKNQIKIIDHHGKHSNKEASLLQVLKLFNQNPDEDQRLIAANDARYINGMERMGANERKIRKIRERDRKAQGITADEYKNTKYKCEYTKDGSICIVKTKYDRFVSIRDKLYFDFEPKKRKTKNIIYNDTKIVFYGFSAAQLKAICKKYGIEEKKYYYGGGEYGYFGIEKAIWAKGQMQKIINEVVADHNEKVPLSTHTFLFPFRFDYISQKSQYHSEFAFYKSKNITDRLNIKKLIERLSGEDSNWSYKKFDLNSILQKEETKYYSEFAYFYDYAREALYNMQDDTEETDALEDEISYYFELNDFIDSSKKNRYIITYPKGKYDLKIDGIALRIFATGVAVLSIHLENYDYPRFEDVKSINEYGRRFYPQYLFKDESGNICKPGFLPCSVSIQTEKKVWAHEDFDVENVATKDFNKIRIGEHIMKLLKKDIFTQDFEGKSSFYIQPIIDDRMFVLSWYGSNDIAKELTTCSAYKYSNSWYEYLFVDKHEDSTVQNEKMKEKLLADATYDRWSNWGTLYGVTRYSFVALTNGGDFGKNTIRVHMDTMYFQMIMLLLATRASILRFSDEIAAIANLSSTKEEERLSNLYGHYLRFYNRLYFKEVTHQDQGIEIYDMALTQMRIPEHIEKLDNKFTKLHDLANLKANNRENKAMNGLNILAATLAPPALVIGIFSIEVFDYNKSYTSLGFALFAAAFSALVGYVGIKQWVKHNQKGENHA